MTDVTAGFLPSVSPILNRRKEKKKRGGGRQRVFGVIVIDH